MPPRKLVLVLDLDETLIFYEKKNHKLYERPHLQSFLEKASKMWKLVIFTASTKAYADRLIDSLDRNKLISKRYYRDSCTQTN